MVDISSLKPGDIVKIVDSWPGHIGQNSQGDMDKWLGATMTVRKQCGTGLFGGVGVVPYVEMAEDFAQGDGWGWNGYMIDCVVRGAGFQKPSVCTFTLSPEPIVDEDLYFLFS